MQVSCGDRQSVIDAARLRWSGDFAASRPDLDLRGLIDESLDLAGFPRLRAEERQAIAPEQPRYRTSDSEPRS
ncbi:MAG: hypothetical protein Q7R41_15775, partial [Phycisphaerales bacterium]|nr:hypothetical protein [Phycisphaerales bacterium]